jgi:hypothetical protein
MAGKLRVVLLIVLVVVAASIVWQVAAAQIEYRELQSDLREITAQIGGRIGLDAPSSDDDLRNLVIRRAADSGITLQPEQVTIRRIETNGDWGVSVAVDYDISIGLLGVAYPMHFSLSASHS